MNIAAIQKDLSQLGFDGWLIFDFRRSNDLGCHFLKIPEDALLTRRFFYWIPVKGEPVKIVHTIENHVLDHLPGKTVEYRTWEELEGGLQKVLTRVARVAMEYSPMGCLPYLSKVDGGTLDLVRKLGVQVASSADLLKESLSDEQIEGHLFAASVVDEVVELAWQRIVRDLGQITEYGVQQFILAEFAKRGCVADDAPICAVNANSANPHYSPAKSGEVRIAPGDFIMIDLSCKKKEPGSIYADITRVGVAGKSASAKQNLVFQVVRQAQEAGLQLIMSRFARDEPLMGWEVDQACRKVIEEAGYGRFFTHRTGHNLGQHIHGNGTHMDNFETKDIRKILKRTCFTIEPGIYLPGEFGVRLEYDVLIHADGRAEVTGGRQNEIKKLF